MGQQDLLVQKSLPLKTILLYCLGKDGRLMHGAGQTQLDWTSVVVKDLRLKDEDKDEDLKIGPRGQGLSSRTTTLQTPGLQ